MTSFLRWLRLDRSGSRKAVKFSAGEVRFIAEQDGVPEQALKQQWHAILTDHPEIGRAYLAQAIYATSSDPNVVLCLSSTKGADPALVEALAIPFRATFRTDAHLDTAFLTPDQEADVARVCSPFYAAV